MFNIYITKIFYNQYADGMLCINSAKYKDLKETHFWLATGIMLKPEQLQMKLVTAWSLSTNQNTELLFLK